MPTVGQRLKNYRENAGLTTAEVGEILKVTAANVSQMEHDSRKPDVEKLILLSRAYGVTIDELVGNPYVKRIRSNDIDILFRSAQDAGLSAAQIADALEFAARMTKKEAPPS